MIDCGHQWERLHSQYVTHLADEINSRRRSRPVTTVICVACAQRGFRYPHSRVVYTWDPNQENWLTGEEAT